jgi:hypothetical protein
MASVAESGTQLALNICGIKRRYGHQGKLFPGQVWLCDWASHSNGQSPHHPWSQRLGCGAGRQGVQTSPAIYQLWSLTHMQGLCSLGSLNMGGKSDHECEHHPCTCSLAAATKQRALFFTCCHTLGYKGSTHCTHYAQTARCLVQT